MSEFAVQLMAGVLVLLLAIGPAFAAGLLLVRRRRLARKRKRSPLTSELLRTPGQSLRLRLDEVRQNFGDDLMILVTVPLLLLALLYVQALVSGRWTSIPVLAIVLAGIAVFATLRVRSLYSRGEMLDRLRLGFDAELAVGQELDQLMREGAVVFHDLQADGFNVDHVVISRQGVFAVETKGYAKPNDVSGKAGATATFDGEALSLPHWSSKKPIQQAERQAKWLSEWLTSATGESVRASGVLALPGWFVERKGRGSVIVLSGKELQRHLLKSQSSAPLSEEQVKRVIHQVEQRCRDLRPEYRPDDVATR